MVWPLPVGSCQYHRIGELQAEELTQPGGRRYITSLAGPPVLWIASGAVNTCGVPAYEVQDSTLRIVYDNPAARLLFPRGPHPGALWLAKSTLLQGYNLVTMVYRHEREMIQLRRRVALLATPALRRRPHLLIPPPSTKTRPSPPSLDHRDIHAVSASICYGLLFSCLTLTGTLRWFFWTRRRLNTPAWAIFAPGTFFFIQYVRRRPESPPASEERPHATSIPSPSGHTSPASTGSVVSLTRQDEIPLSTGRFPVSPSGGGDANPPTSLLTPALSSPCPTSSPPGIPSSSRRALNIRRAGTPDAVLSLIDHIKRGRLSRFEEELIMRRLQARRHQRTRIARTMDEMGFCPREAPPSSHNLNNLSPVAETAETTVTTNNLSV